MALKLIICSLDVLKNDFVEVVEAMFQGVERPYELISCILSMEKSDLDSRLSDFLNRRMGLRTNNLPSERRKMRLR
jgi:predicted transcriptional regulator